MKNFFAVVFISSFLLVSCGQNKTETETKGKVTIQPNKVEEVKKIEASTGSTSIDNSGSISTSTGELTDSGSEDALNEIDKLIEDISKEK